MSAPPPQPPLSAVDDYYDHDDGIDWEVAALEMEKVCALKAATSSAPNLAPASVQQQPLARPPERSATAPAGKASVAAGGGGRQSTLDCFINPSTSGQRQREMPAPAPVAAPAPDGGHPGVRAGEGCSRQAGKNGLEDRFMASFSLRREQEKPAPVPAVAPVLARGRTGIHGRKGCWRQAGQEIVYDPCAVALDHEAVQTWIYPTNVQIREYQKAMVEKALFTNTLVALPTGLGKTFIAAVVMYNYFRWFPEGKIVFTAPSRPLVTQQIEACHNIVGIPQDWTVEMKGTDSPSNRSILWKSKRVFFVTPQVLDNDIRSGTCMIKQMVCLVIDEAHKASGNHAYCVAVQKLVEAHVPLRILALTATPGSKYADIQSVINNLCISELIHYDEEDSEVRKYINTRDVEVRKIPFGSDATEVDNLLMDIIRPRINRLRDAGVIDQRDPANWNAYDLLCYKDKFTEAPPSHFRDVDREDISKSFVALCSLCHTRKLLVSHGIKQAYEFMVDKLKKRSLNLLCKNEQFWQLKDKMRILSSQGSCVKIKELKVVMVEHFSKSDSKDSRVIIFSHFRGSVNEIYCSLKTIDDKLVRPIEFIGQSSAGKRLKGQSQKTQQAILQKFRSGEYNVLVATSIGEEGLDIIEVDLVVCFDANISPLRMIQRMGRTGRKHDGRVVVLACDGDEAKGYEKKQADTKTMKKLLRNSKRFEYHASPRMIPHIFKPELKYVQFTIEKYIPLLKRTKGAVKGTSPALKMSEEDDQLIARYFGMDKDVWRPSLVAFPRFQLSPSVVHKVPHSFRTTDMLIDAMQQLQDLSCFRTKCKNPFQGPADAVTVRGQTNESTGTEAMSLRCDSVEASSKEVLSQSFYMPNSQVRTYPIHTFFSGDHVTVDSKGNVAVTFVPVLPHAFVFHKEIENADWCHRSLKMSRPCKSAEVSNTTVEFDCPRYGTDSDKHMLQNSVSNLHLHSHSEQAVNVNDCVLTTPCKTFTTPRGKWDQYCSARLASSSFSGQDNMALSPRLTHYIEEGIVPDSPLLDVSHIQVELDGAINDQTSAVRCQKEPSGDEKNDHAISSKYILDQSRVQAEEPACPSNVKICTPAVNTSTNLLCDSFSSDCQLRSAADISGSVQQAPKYRRLCKYGDKIKKLSISLYSCRDGFGDISTVPNRIEHTTGNKGKAKRHLDTYIDEEVEVSQDADVSEDEDDNPSEDKYEDSFIDDQETPGEFTQTEQGHGNNVDMMGFYRQSLLTQTPVVLPSRYLDASDGSASSRTRNTSSSETGHNSVERIETPKGLPPIHHTMDPSPLWYQLKSMEGASIIQHQSETTTGNCGSSSKTDCRKRKLNFQQPSSIPVINLELEPAPPPSSHVATGAIDDVYLDDDFFEGLDLDAIEAQATEQWKQRITQLTQKPVEPKKASEISFAPPSFDLGF